MAKITLIRQTALLKKVLIILSAFCFLFNGFGQATKKNTAVKSTGTDTSKNLVEKTMELLLQDPDLKNASFSFLAKDVKTGEVIAEHHPDMSLTPASTIKVVTTAAALEILGAGYKFKTVLQYSGYIDSACVLHGNIYVKGGGDPTLGSRFFDEYYYSPNFLDEWALAVRNAGIDSVNGSVVGDADIYGPDPTPTTWVYGDLGSYYGAPPSGLTIFDNNCYLEFQSGPNSGDSAQLVCVEPLMPDFDMENFVTGSNINEDNTIIIGPPYRSNRYIKGTIPKNRNSYEIRGSIPDPPLQAAFELQMSLHNRGIAVTKGYTTTREMKLEHLSADAQRYDFYTQYSPGTGSIVYWVNMNSVNLFAEHLCIQIGLVKYGSATTASGCAAITEHWKKRGIDTDGLYMFDGCGLSRHDAVSARHLTDIMVYMSKSKNASAFEGTLPVAGKSGTLGNIGKKTVIAGNLKAKSGTMQRVKSYSGYVTTRSGRKLAFAMIVNNFNCPTRTMVAKLEKLMVSMGNFNQ